LVLRNAREISENHKKSSINKHINTKAKLLLPHGRFPTLTSSWHCCLQDLFHEPIPRIYSPNPFLEPIPNPNANPLHMCVECSLALSEDDDNAAEVENKKHFLIASDKTQHTYITYPPYHGFSRPQPLPTLWGNK